MIVKLKQGIWAILLVVLLTTNIANAKCDSPSGLNASVNGSIVSLTWTGNGTSFLIEVENRDTDIDVIPEQTASSPFTATLPAGNYKFKVRTVCGSDHSDWSSTVNFSVNGSSNPPSGGGGGTAGTCTIPTGLVATASSTGAILTWNGTATSYQIEVENRDTDVDVIPEQTANSPFTATLPSGNYKFKVRSVCGGDHSDWSPTVNFSVNSSSNPPSGGGGTAGTCTIPTGLAATASSSGAILTWNGTAASYQIEVENRDTDVDVIPEQTANSPFTATLPTGNYKFKVRSVCGGNQSDWSPTVNFSVNGSSNPPSGGGGTAGTCTIPTGLAATASSSGAILTWNGTAASYQIEVENRDTDVDVIPEQTANSPFTATLPAGNYKFKVRSVCGGNQSDWSSTVNFSVNGSSNPPSGGGGGTAGTCKVPTILGSSVSGNDIKLFWEGEAINFNIEVEKISNDSSIIKEMTVTNPYVSNLPDGSYKFKVRSVCGQNQSDWSAWSLFTIGTSDGISGNPFSKPVDSTCVATSQLMIIAAKDSSLSLTWKSAGPLATYSIEVESEHTITSYKFKKEDIKDTSITIKGLQPNTQYKIQLVTNCGNGVSPNVGSIISSTPLVNNTPAGSGSSKFICDAPAGLGVNLNDNSFLIHWLSSQGARTYRLEIESQENTPFFKRTIAVNSNSFLFNIPIAAGTYKIKVRGICQFGQSNWSTVVSIKLANPIQGISIEQRLSRNTINVNVYPNPASEYVNIRSEYTTDQPVLMQILNVHGQVQREYKNRNLDDFSKVSVNNLQPGIYYIRIVSGYVQSINKIMISR